MVLPEELKSTENKIGFSRPYCNDVVMDYNNQRQFFPTMFVASFCNFAEEAYWQIQAAEERMPPTVSFSS